MESMECNDGIKDAYRKVKEEGMSYSDAINFTYELESTIERKKKQLADLQKTGAGQEEINSLKACIAEREDLLQKMQFDIHGLSGTL